MTKMAGTAFNSQGVNEHQGPDRLSRLVLSTIVSLHLCREPSNSLFFACLITSLSYIRALPNTQSYCVYTPALSVYFGYCTEFVYLVKISRCNFNFGGLFFAKNNKKALFLGRAA
jgi:hypothetical protein